MRRNASGVFVPLARRGQSAERAGAPPLFGALGSPGGDPGAGVAPARGTLEQRQIARNNRARIHSRFQIPIWGMVSDRFVGGFRTRNQSRSSELGDRFHSDEQSKILIGKKLETVSLVEPNAGRILRIDDDRGGPHNAAGF